MPLNPLTSESIKEPRPFSREDVTLPLGQLSRELTGVSTQIREGRFPRGFALVPFIGPYLDMIAVTHK